MAADQDDDDAPLEFRMALLSIAAFWTLYFLTVSGRSIAFHPLDAALVTNHAIVTAAGGGLTLVLYACLQAADRRSMAALVAAAFLFSVPIAVAFAAINHATFYVIAPVESVLSELAEKPAEHPDPVRLILFAASDWYFFIVAWAVLYIALSYARRVQLAERRAARFRAQAQAAELRALRYQVKPGFLFNALDTLTTLVRRGRFDEADRLIMTLSTFFRSSLTGDPAGDVSLADEFRLVELYVEVEQARLDGRLTFTAGLPPELEAIAVPGLIVQPLVEAATMGLGATTTDRLDLAISARTVFDRLVIALRFAGMETGAGPSASLEEVAARLHARFGHDGQLTWSRTDGAASVQITMPLTR